YTVASRRSPVTLASVTVTLPSRGSLISCSSADATIWAIRLASLRARARSATAHPLFSAYHALVVRTEKPSVRGQQLDFRALRHETLTGVQYVPHMSTVHGHRRHTEQRPSIQIQVPSLGYRHLIAFAQLGDDRAYHGALLDRKST